MPQITSCPECSKKLRVPDELIGKKVKCPGCATMFIAESDDQDEPAPAPAPKKAPPKPPAERARPDAVTSSPRAKRREEDEDEEEAPRPRGKSRDEEEDEEAPPRPRGKRRDEEEEDDRPSRRREEIQDEDRRPRARRDEEEDDRPQRSRRDDEEDDDRRPLRGRDRDDEDDDDDRPSRRRGNNVHSSRREQVLGWQKVRSGTNFVFISGWLSLALGALYFFFALVMSLIAGPDGRGGFPTGGNLETMGVLGCGFAAIACLLGLSSLVLLMVGTGFCMATPRLRGHSMRGLAMTTFYLYVGAVATYFLSILMVIVFAPLGILGVIGAGLAFLAAHVLWMVYLRKVCLFFKDPTLAGSVLTNLIVQLVVPVAGSIFVVGLMFALHSAGQAGVLISSCFTLLLFVAMLGIFIWYLMILRNVRDLVDR